MKVSASQKRLIDRVLSVFETGSPEGDYSKITIFKDGPGGIRQITYGRWQTTEYGNLKTLVRDYSRAEGEYSEDFMPFVGQVGNVPLTDDANFKSLLKAAGKKDHVMKRTQDAFFERVYYTPAMLWATQHGFALPLSALVIYDSFIHSGRIRQDIRNSFPERPPSSGGDERAWTSAYVRARDSWLRNSSKPHIRATTYRTECFLKEIKWGNWELTQLPIDANGTQVT